MSRARLNADHYAGSTDASVLSGVLPVGVTGGSGLTALGTVTAGNLSNTAIVYPAGHVIQQSPIARYTTITSTASISYSAGLHILTMTIPNLLVANTRIRIEFIINWWHADAYSGIATVSRTLDGTTVHQHFENLANGVGVLAIRDTDQGYAAYHNYWTNEEDLTNDVGDSVAYTINISCQLADNVTYINRGLEEETGNRGASGCHGTIWEVAK